MSLDSYDGSDMLGYWSPSQPVIQPQQNALMQAAQTLAPPQMEQFGLSPDAVSQMPMPNPTFGGLGGFARRAAVGMNNGLGRLGAGLFPINPAIANTMTPDQISGMRQQALLNAGLGVMGASANGQRFGAALAGGLGGAQRQFQSRLGDQFQIAQQLQRQQHGLQREAIGDQRYGQERADKLGQQSIENTRSDAQLAVQAAHWQAQNNIAKAQLDRYTTLTPEQRVQQQQLQADRARVQELLAKPKRTADESTELDYLTKGALSRMTRSDPFAALGVGAPGGSPAADPVIDDRRY